MGFEVVDIAAQVADLCSRGVVSARSPIMRHPAVKETGHGFD